MALVLSINCRQKFNETANMTQTCIRQLQTIAYISTFSITTCSLLRFIKLKYTLLIFATFRNFPINISPNKKSS